MNSLGSFEITYFQCRPTPDVPKLKRERALEVLTTELGWAERPLGDLYDTAAVDSQLLRRFDITGLAVDASRRDGSLPRESPSGLDDGSDNGLDCGFGPPEVRATALFASFGFVVVGITLAWDDAPLPPAVDVANASASAVSDAAELIRPDRPSCSPACNPFS